MHMHGLDGRWRRAGRERPPLGLAEALSRIESGAASSGAGGQTMSPVTARLAAVEGALEPVLESLAAQGVGVWGWKGIDYARTLYPDPSMRPMSDADLFVRPEDMRSAAGVFLRHGWTMMNPGTPLLTSMVVGAVTLCRGCVEADLHCHPLYFPWALPGRLPSDLFQTPRRLGDLLLGFRWTHATLLHLLHMSSHRHLRPEWWLDLALLCGRMTPSDWRSLSYWGAASGLGASLAAILEDCRSSTGRGAPCRALDALRGGPSREGLPAIAAGGRGLPTLSAALAGTGWRRTSFCAALVYRLAAGRPAAIPVAAR